MKQAKASGTEWAIGLMSGTSLDGVDAALVRTDGVTIAELGPHIVLPYDDSLRQKLRAATRVQEHIAPLERELTLRHAEAVAALLAAAGMRAEEIAVIGFHGQTVKHAPQEGISWQIGDGSLLAERTGIPVVNDFRRRDVAAGGQGAPLVPVYHAALAEFLGLALPVAFLNLGGISNVTYLAANGDICAFDCGPANGLLNEWMMERAGKAMDEDGQHARAGRVHNAALETWLAHAYFAAKPPKSLDRHSFNLDPVWHLNLEDGAATLAAFAAMAVEAALAHLPEAPREWILCGGGVHNPTLVEALALRLGNVRSVNAAGSEADALEGQAFAYLAMRHLRGLPTSLPSTTGAARAVVGGAFYPRAASAAP